MTEARNEQQGALADTLVSCIGQPVALHKYLVFREDNIGELALAALIREDIGANLGPAAGRRDRHLLVQPPQRGLRRDHRHPDRIGTA